MATNDFQKKKKTKEQMKKFFMNLVVWVLIIAFVSTIGVYMGSQQRVNIVKIAEVNNKLYTYQPGSLFYYLVNNVRASILENLGKQHVDSTELERYSFEYASKLLINNAIVYDFAKQLNIEPSKDRLRNILEYTLRGRLVTVPEKGLLEYGQMEYANEALTSRNGDMASVMLMFPSNPEVSSYYELENMKAQGEILYIDITNYVISKITDKNVESYYLTNISNYIQKITAEDVSVKNKALAYEISKFAKEQGWNKMMDSFRGKYTYLNNVTLKNTNGLSKRFFLALSTKKGEASDKPQFEGGEYHIIKVTEFQEMASLPVELKKTLYKDYALKNFAGLRQKYETDIQTVIKKAESALQANPDFKTAAISSGMNYSKTSQLTPVSFYITDEQGKTIQLPFADNPDWLDHIFSAKSGEISKTYSDDGYIVKIKQLNKSVNTKIDYSKIDRQVLSSYAEMKSRSISKDWLTSLKKNQKTKIFEKEIRDYLVSRTAE